MFKKNPPINIIGGELVSVSGGGTVNLPKREGEKGFSSGQRRAKFGG